MLSFYNDLVTAKSWQTLQELRRKLDFILIGGWAVYLYAKALKSKDVDIIINYDQLEKLRGDFEITKNEWLKKYEARREEVQIDVYLPHYSSIGVPVEEITDIKTRETFKVPSPELLLILKQLVLKQRELSPKGQKDEVDILSLAVFGGVDWGKYLKLARRYNLAPDLRGLIRRTTKIPELALNQHVWGRKKKDLLAAL